MTKNQKIALGCGGAGCLGLIVVAIAGVLIYFLAYRTPARSRNYNFNVSTNRNSNSNDNTDFSTNTNTNTNDNSSNSNSSASTLSKDDKHKLYYAASVTGDTELIRRVLAKLDLLEDDFTQGAKFQAFSEEHASWMINNLDFIQTIDTPDKARTYVNEHISD